MNVRIINGEWYWCEDCAWVEASYQAVYQQDPSDQLEIRNDDGDYHYYHYDSHAVQLLMCDECGEYYSDGDMPYAERLYQCGECDNSYEDRSEAVDCCR